MSETDHYTGKLIEIVPKEDETLDDLLLSILTDKEKEEMYRYEETVRECFEDAYYKEYVITDEKLYKIKGMEIPANKEDIFTLNENTDGSFNFEVKYYNGGCGFDEAIEKAFEGRKR